MEKLLEFLKLNGTAFLMVGSAMIYVTDLHEHIAVLESQVDDIKIAQQKCNETIDKIYDLELKKK